jgi:hypothetical protein
MTSFLVHRMTQISSVKNKNRVLADYNYFEIKFPFFLRTFNFCQHRSSNFLDKQWRVGAKRL